MINCYGGVVGTNIQEPGDTVNNNSMHAQLHVMDVDPLPWQFSRS